MRFSDEAKALIVQRFKEGADLKQRLACNPDIVGEIARITEAILEAYQSNRKVILFGNGGSASDAQHIAAELVGRYRLERKALAAIALTVNTSSLTAIGNDYSFGLVFARQIEALGQEGDVAIGISTSGNSENVVQGLQMARANGLVTVGLTGRDGGAARALADFCVCVPSRETPRIQETHIAIGHILCEIIEARLFGETATGWLT